MKFNFDIFGIKAKRKEREARRLAEALAARQRYQERKRMIDDYLGEFRKNNYGWWWGSYFFFFGKKSTAFAIIPMSSI